MLVTTGSVLMFHERITPKASLTNICSSSKVTLISVSNMSILSLSTRDRAFSRSKFELLSRALNLAAKVLLNYLAIPQNAASIV